MYYFYLVCGNKWNEKKVKWNFDILCWDSKYGSLSNEAEIYVLMHM